MVRMVRHRPEYSTCRPVWPPGRR